MNDLKTSTLGERILLGVIAGLFGLVGFYVGYEHLSNDVNPILIGAITAVIVMVGCMAAAFILEELIRKIPAAKKKNYEEIRKQPVFGTKKKTSGTKEPQEQKPSPEEATKEPATEEAIPEPKPAFAKRMTLLAPAQAVSLTENKKAEVKAEENVAVEKVNKEEPKDLENTASSSEWDEEEIIVKPKPVAPVRPSAPSAPEKAKEEVAVSEDKAESLSLREFIKAHPEFSARKMVKEYRLAGGTESTDDILNLMN